MIRLLTLPSPRSRRRSAQIDHFVAGIYSPFSVRHASVATARGATNAVALQILFRPSVNAIERFLDVLDRVRHAETQITFAEFAKRGPGERSDPGILEKRVG